jgi:hypothetical protein
MAFPYPTLQEAYQTPAFALATRRRRASGKSAVQEVGEQIETFTTLDKTLEDYARRPASSGSGMHDSYAGRSADYRYACKQFGVCPRGEGIEGFVGAPDEGLGRVAEKCKSAQAPAYEYPLSADDKRQFAAAMKVAVDAPAAGANRPASEEPPQARRVDMSRVDGYSLDDDDLDEYLRVSDMQSVETQPRLKGPDDAGITPYLKHVAVAAAAPAPQAVAAPQPSQAPAGQSQQRWMDFLLFVCAGVLLIVLLEQVFKLALITGMRDTVAIIQPYLNTLQM